MPLPETFRARFFRQVSNGAWTRRIDISNSSPSMTIAQAEAHCAVEYGFLVECVEAEMTLVLFETTKSERMVNAIHPPVRPPPPLTAAEIAQAKAMFDTAAEVTAEIDKAFLARSTATVKVGLTDVEKAAITDKQLNLIAKAQRR